MATQPVPSIVNAPRWPFDVARIGDELAARDEALGALIARVGPFTLVPRETESTFEALARSIVYQQLSGKAATTIWNRFVGLHPEKSLSPMALLELTEAVVRGAGISGSKQRALRDLAERCSRAEIPTLSELHGMPEETIIERLTTVRGIGRWSVEMLLIFRLARPDVLPVTDLGIRKGFMQTFGMKSLPAERTLLRRAERWRPYRSVASWYLWRALDTPVVI